MEGDDGDDEEERRVTVKETKPGGCCDPNPCRMGREKATGDETRRWCARTPLDILVTSGFKLGLWQGCFIYSSMPILITIVFAYCGVLMSERAEKLEFQKALINLEVELRRGKPGYVPRPPLFKPMRKPLKQEVQNLRAGSYLSWDSQYKVKDPDSTSMFRSRVYIVNGYRIGAKPCLNSLLEFDEWGELYKVSKNGESFIMKIIYGNYTIVFLNQFKSKAVHPFLVEILDIFSYQQSIAVIRKPFGQAVAADVSRRSRSSPPMESSVIRFMFTQMLLAVLHLHEFAGMVHRDIRLANMYFHLSSSECWLVLGETGVGDLISQRISETKERQRLPFHYAPEFENDAPYDGKSDMWFLGVALYQLCANFRHPFIQDSDTPRVAIDKLVGDEPQQLRSRHIDTDILQAMNDLLAKEPKRRPKARDLLGRPTFAAEARNIANMLAGTRFGQLLGSQVNSLSSGSGSADGAVAGGAGTAFAGGEGQSATSIALENHPKGYQGPSPVVNEVDASDSRMEVVPSAGNIDSIPMAAPIDESSPAAAASAHTGNNVPGEPAVDRPQNVVVSKEDRE